MSNEKPVPPVVLPVDLRDYFAAKAMAAWICAKPTLAGETLNGGPEHSECLTKMAYEWADEMLKARQA